MHAAAAALFVLAGLGSHVLSFDLLGDVLIASSGLVLMWPTSAHPRPEDLPRMWALINATGGDPLAPFAMQTGKCYHFTARRHRGAGLPDAAGVRRGRRRPGRRRGAIPRAGRRLRRHVSYPRLADRGGGLQRAAAELWTDATVLGQSLRAVPIGRDVVVDVSGFDMVGRKFRNLRQAVKRTHNAGITTEIVAEQELDDKLLAELTDVVRASPRGAHTDRGFYMNLDGVLEGRFPGIQLIIARDASGKCRASTGMRPRAAAATSPSMCRGVAAAPLTGSTSGSAST